MIEPTWIQRQIILPAPAGLAVWIGWYETGEIEGPIPVIAMAFAGEEFCGSAKKVRALWTATELAEMNDPLPLPSFCLANSGWDDPWVPFGGSEAYCVGFSREETRSELERARIRTAPRT